MVIDAEGLVAKRYGAGTVWLVRPDQHLAARFDNPSVGEIVAAYERARRNA